jgi:hypothetical protein
MGIVTWYDCKIGIPVEFAHLFNPVSFQDGMWTSGAASVSEMTAGSSCCQCLKSPARLNLGTDIACVQQKSLMQKYYLEQEQLEEVVTPHAIPYRTS